METFRRVMAFGFGMALVGAVIASFVVPRTLAWYNEPAGSAQVLCDMGKVTRDTAHSLIMGQLVAAGIGLVLGLGGAGFFVARRRKKQGDAAPAQ